LRLLDEQERRVNKVMNRAKRRVNHGYEDNCLGQRRNGQKKNEWTPGLFNTDECEATAAVAGMRED
jgi:hypothetical protein